MADIRAILFDLDGVLVDAREWHYEALNRALAEAGLAPIARADHLARFDGLPTRRKLALLGVAPERIEEINRAKQRHTRQLIAERCVPTAHHLDALKRLKAEGYRIGVCTNSVRESLQLLLERTQLAPYLDLALSYEDVAAPKPDAAIYREAMRRLGVTPDETLILEDNPHGIEAARASGAQVMVVGDTEEVTYARIHAAIGAR